MGCSLGMDGVWAASEDLTSWANGSHVSVLSVQNFLCSKLMLSMLRVEF
jgi:hypothetical protein